jgi:hypothetical protein
MNLATETQLRVGWVGTAFWILLAMLVVVGDWILYFIFWNLPLLILGVFLTIGSLIALAFLARLGLHRPKESIGDDENLRHLV